MYLSPGFCRCFLFLVFCCAFNAGFARADANCLDCHSDHSKYKTSHAPYGAGECLSCHQLNDKMRHPDEKGAVILQQSGAKLCLMCHDALDKKKFVHSPVSSGECTICHSPHASPNAKLLVASGAALCLTCHEDSYRYKFGHGPATAGNCLACHDPHQSDNPKLLKLKGATLCLTCHTRFNATGKSVHAPVLKGNCTACHAPHGSNYRYLLRKDVPNVFYMPYSTSNYSFCFDCHNREIAQDKQTDIHTNFRDGTRNLHTLHVNMPDKGRTCKTCHDPHAASQEKLVKDKIPGYGKWQIPIKYQKTMTGGTCIVGCHKPRSYNR